MSQKRTRERTDYERSRPAPGVVASLAVACLAPALVVAVLAAPVATLAALVAAPAAVRAARVGRRHTARGLARATALRVEPLLPAALQR